MTDSIFLADGDLFVPTEHARGPWDPRTLHGGAPAALMASAFERTEPGGELPEQDRKSNHVPSGAATVWMRLRHQILPGEPLTPIARVVAASDFGNGVATVLPFEDYLFINADLTISLNRRPEGEWVALQARTLLHPDGIGWAESVLHDERGSMGRATQALVVQPR